MLPAHGFANRIQELAFLERMFARDSSQFLVLWGRRRVGKTRLIQEFSRGRRVLYHVGTQSTERLAVESWSAQAAEFFQDSVLRVQPLQSWEAALAYLTDRCQRDDSGWGVIFDEFPYLVQSAPRLPSLLQAAWDSSLKHTRVKLILCGSSIAMMESIFFSQQAPLYGRRTGQWKVEPFRIEDLALLFPRLELVALLELYCVIGGLPMYAERLDKEASLLSNIRDHILTKGELLYEEVPFLLREELREPRVYQSILSVIASGAQRFSEISSKTGLDRAHLTGYLASLGELGLVTREVPVTEVNPEKSRRGRYILNEPFVRFWYRFVYPNFSRLEAGDVEGVLYQVIEPQLREYTSLHVEMPLASMCQRGLLRGNIPFEPAFVGRHWSAREEFDVVAIDHQRTKAFVAEVKWSERPVSGGLLEGLRQRIATCEALRGLEVTPAVISRSGFRDSPNAGDLLIDLSTLQGSFSTAQ